MLSYDTAAITEPKPGAYRKCIILQAETLEGAEEALRAAWGRYASPAHTRVLKPSSASEYEGTMALYIIWHRWCRSHKPDIRDFVRAVTPREEVDVSAVWPELKNLKAPADTVEKRVRLADSWLGARETLSWRSLGIES